MLPSAISATTAICFAHNLDTAPAMSSAGVLMQHLPGSWPSGVASPLSVPRSRPVHHTAPALLPHFIVSPLRGVLCSPWELGGHPAGGSAHCRPGEGAHGDRVILHHHPDQGHALLPCQCHLAEQPISQASILTANHMVLNISGQCLVTSSPPCLPPAA